MQRPSQTLGDQDRADVPAAGGEPAAQASADPWQAAEHLGMTLKTLLENYGYRHPKHLQGPRSVFDRPPQLPATKQEQPSSNVLKISGNR